MATLAFKPNVRIAAHQLEDPRFLRMLTGLCVTAPSLQGSTVVITSARDGTHSRASLHYVGLAVDVRSTGDRIGAPKDESPAVWAARLRQYLGSAYDVIVEADHIHVEYDPD